MNTEQMRALSIEDIILSHDSRGISKLRHLMSQSFCDDAAQFILDRRQSGKKTALIATGFYILSAGAPETDGPPGAIAIAKALEKLGFDVVHITDCYSSVMLNVDGQKNARVLEFPIADHATSKAYAHKVLSELQPALILSTERCGFNRDKKYLNMRGRDISDFTAKVDYLFLGQEDTVGIGDGGNEIGMGSLAPHVSEVPTLPSDPAVTPVNKLIIASVSNWGAYGLVASLSKLTGYDLLPTVEWEKQVVSELVARGAVDGVTGAKKCCVDNLEPDQNAWALRELRKLNGLSK